MNEICKIPGCEKQLGERNVKGFCRDHFLQRSRRTVKTCEDCAKEGIIKILKQENVSGKCFPHYRRGGGKPKTPKFTMPMPPFTLDELLERRRAIDKVMYG